MQPFFWLRLRQQVLAGRLLAAITILVTGLSWPTALTADDAAPSVIDIGSRRELFIDDLLIGSLTNAHVVQHQPEPHDVALVCDEPWEGNTSAYYTLFQDGDRFRMYYRGSHFDEQTKKASHPEFTCYAESRDGITWTKPHLGLFEYAGSKDNNIVWAGSNTHNFTPFKDSNPNCPADARYKALAGTGLRWGGKGLQAYKSADGIHWSLMQDEGVITKGYFDSQNLAFWNPHTEQYLSFQRSFRDGVRDITTATSQDFIHWTEPVFLKHGDAAPEHLYTNAIQPYLRAPHLLLGFPTRFQPKTEQVEPILISSRDGLNFKRWPEALIPITAPQDRDGNRSNYMTYGLLQLPGHSDTLSVYGTEAYYSGPGSRVRRFTFRTDGFVSVRATGDAGELVTPAITFSGDRLNLNYVTHDNGSLKVEVQDADGTALPGFELSQCDALHGDAIDGVVEWSGNSDVGSLAGQSVRLRFVLTNADLFALKFSPGQADNPAAAVHHAQGEMSGEVTSTSVLLQSRLTAIPGPVLDDMGDVPGATGEACFEWSESATFETSERTDWFTATAEADFTVRAQLAQLKPGTVYYYRLIYGPDRQHTQAGPIRHFKTLPLAQSAATVQFCMGSCMNYNSFTTGKSNGGGPVTATAEDKQLGYPVFAAMTRLQPDFFIGTGDIVYYDHPHQTAAQTLPELRKKWHEQFRYPRLIEFFGQTAAFWSKDDHDFRFNDADLQGQRLPDAPTGIGLFREQLPIHAADDEDSPTYRTHRLNQHVQLWFVEGRDYRSPNRMPDGPDKTIWGAEQRKWLQDTLKASDATWKIIISPTPMVGPDRASKKDNHTNPAGFRHEGESFFAWLNDNNVDNVLTFCGDRHWQYHSIHPSGVEEFCCGALNDENSIRGVKPGAKGSTDPDGLIKQPYLYSDPTGGFLHVTAEQQQQPTLTIRFYDDTGRMMHEVVRESVAER